MTKSAKGIHSSAGRWNPARGPSGGRGGERGSQLTQPNQVPIYAIRSSFTVVLKEIWWMFSGAENTLGRVQYPSGRKPVCGGGRSDLSKYMARSRFTAILKELWSKIKCSKNYVFIAITPIFCWIWFCSHLLQYCSKPWSERLVGKIAPSIFSNRPANRASWPQRRLCGAFQSPKIQFTLKSGENLVSIA